VKIAEAEVILLAISEVNSLPDKFGAAANDF